MHVDLYRSLRSVKIADEEAVAVVRTVEEHIAMKISEATRGLEAQNKGLEAQIGALKAEISSVKWLLGFIGTILAIIGLAPFIAKI